ncbi:MAG: DUF859 domain-containing protein [Youngiibacter sp.]|nr:DUF859 domain-containing protein [Youngiibacter sp.]
MALSGTIYNSPQINSNYQRLRIEWTATQDIGANTSTITAKLYWWSVASLSSSVAKNVSITIAGETFTGTGTVGVAANTDKLLLTAVKTVTHNSDGNLTTAISGFFQIKFTLGGTYYEYCTIPSTNITLDTIPRYANITSFYLHSTTCIQFGFTVATDRDIDAIQYSLNGGAWTGQPAGNILTGLSPGTSYNLRVRVKATASQLWTESGYLYVTTLYLSTASAPNFNLESDVGITISRQTSDLYHDVYLEAYYDGVWNNVGLNTALTNQGASATISPSAAAVSTLFSKHPTVKTVYVLARIVTRYGVGGTVQGETYAYGTAYIVNANPSLVSVSYADINATVQALIGNDQKILRSKSTLRVTAGAATSQKGATLATYKVAIGGNEYSAAANGTASETGKQVTVGTVNQAANQTAVITVTDSRGNTVSLSFTVQILDYVGPQILSAIAQRLNNYEQPTDLIISARRTVVNPGAGDVNNIAMRYRIKLNPSGAYGDYVTITTTDGSIDGIWQGIAVDQYMADYPNDQSYTVEISIADEFTGYAVMEIQLSEGIALMKFLRDKIEAGVPMEVQGLTIPTDFVGVNGDTVPELNIGRATSIAGIDITDLNGWNSLPMMKGVFVYPNSVGLPTAEIYYVLKIGMRDMSNGYACIAINFSTGEFFTGRAYDNTGYPSWRNIG